MFKTIGHLFPLYLLLISGGHPSGYLFYIKNISNLEESVTCATPVKEDNHLFHITKELPFQIKLSNGRLRITSKTFKGPKINSTSLYPKVSGSIEKPWKLLSNGRGSYTLIIADSPERIAKEQFDEQNNAQQGGFPLEQIEVQSSDDSDQ